MTQKPRKGAGSEVSNAEELAELLSRFSDTQMDNDQYQIWEVSKASYNVIYFVDTEFASI